MERRFDIGPLERERVNKWIEMLMVAALRAPVRRMTTAMVATSNELKEQLKELKNRGDEVSVTLSEGANYTQSQTALICFIRNELIDYPFQEEMKDFLYECDQAQKKADPEAMRIAMMLQKNDGAVSEMAKNFMRKAPWEDRAFVSDE
jgi:hypothetical protein